MEIRRIIQERRGEKEPGGMKAEGEEQPQGMENKWNSGAEHGEVGEG